MEPVLVEMPAELPPDMARELAALHARCFNGVAGSQWSDAAFATLLALPTVCGWLSGTKDKAQGFILARVAGDDCEILTFGVDPQNRRNGLGKSLLDAAARWAESEGLARIVLEVAATNVPAQKFYKCRGFEMCGRRDRYYVNPDGPVDALILAAPPFRVVNETRY